MRIPTILGLALVPFFVVHTACDSAPDIVPNCLDEGTEPRESCTDWCGLGIQCGAFETTQATCEERCECDLQDAAEISEACEAAWIAEQDCFLALENCASVAAFFMREECQEEVAATNDECFEDGLPIN